jgi:hypothetical protein
MVMVAAVVAMMMVVPVPVVVVVVVAVVVALTLRIWERKVAQYYGILPFKCPLTPTDLCILTIFISTSTTRSSHSLKYPHYLELSSREDPDKKHQT